MAGKQVRERQGSEQVQRERIEKMLATSMVKLEQARKTNQFKGIKYFTAMVNRYNAELQTH